MPKELPELKQTFVWARTNRINSYVYIHIKVPRVWVVLIRAISYRLFWYGYMGPKLPLDLVPMSLLWLSRWLGWHIASVDFKDILHLVERYIDFELIYASRI